MRAIDHIIVFGERHLRHVLSCYADYYNAARTHLSLGKDTPVQRAVQTVGLIQGRPVLGGTCTINTRGFDLRYAQVSVATFGRFASVVLPWAARLPRPNLPKGRDFFLDA